MDKKYSEEDLIIPALFELFFADKKTLNTTQLIKRLSKVLEPSGSDAEKLFGRNDNRFSQKVRNLISHQKLYPKYATYQKQEKETIITINDVGTKYLLDSEYYNLYSKDREEENKKEYDFDGEETFETVEKYNFLEKNYVSVENVNYTVYELKRKYDKTKKEIEIKKEPQNGLILDDSFQRTGDVWGTKDKVKLIESILMDIPIPFIYLAEGKRGNLVVIDGRQRLTALFEYLDGKYPLRNIDFFPQLKNKKVDKLIGDLECYKTKIEDYHLYVIKIKMSTPEEFKLQIFARVNKTGMQLNPQEIRHALHQGESTDLLEKISNQYDDILAKPRMKDRYLILRYISIRLYYLDNLINYETNQKVTYNSINSFLGDAMNAINTFTVDQIEEIYIDFCKSYQTARNIFGSKAFKTKPKAPINMILFEITLLFVSLCKDKNNVIRCLDTIKNIDIDTHSPSDEDDISETPFEINIKYHRDSKENYLQRLEWIKLILGEINTDDKNNKY